mgnify:CR=1 FL=1
MELSSGQLNHLLNRFPKIEHLYETMVDNIAINHLLILFTMTCTLTMLCCSKRDKKIH